MALIEKRSLWEQIADALRTDIHTGKLAPGSRLISADLAAMWGVSRGPVREALMALENEGLVVSTSRQGTIVGNVSTVDLDEVFSVRETSERAAGLIICQPDQPVSGADLQHVSELLEKIEHSWERDPSDFKRRMILDFDFHQAIVDLAGNSRFSSIYRQMVSQNTHHLSGREIETWPLMGWDQMRESHLGLRDAIANGDAEAFTAAVTEHYRNARTRTVAPRDE